MYICGNRIIEKILKIIRRHDKNDQNTEHINTESITNIRIEYNNTTDQKINQNLKDRIAKLIKENEKYFICEVIRTTTDTILHDSCHDMEKLKRLGYSHRIAADIFKKYGIFIYAADLSGYIYAPGTVRYELQMLIGEYGLDKVTEEIAIYLKKHYIQLGISIVCTP